MVIVQADQVRRLLLTDRHNVVRMQRFRACQRRNLASLSTIHWSDYIRLMLHVIDGRAREWRHQILHIQKGNTLKLVIKGTSLRFII